MDTATLSDTASSGITKSQRQKPPYRRQDDDAASASAVKKQPTAAKRRKRKRTIPFRPLPIGYNDTSRPRGFDFAQVSAADVLSAVVSLLGLSLREVCSVDKFRFNPRSNTITVSTPDEDKQLAYLQIRSLVVGGKTHELRLNANCRTEGSLLRCSRGCGRHPAQLHRAEPAMTEEQVTVPTCIPCHPRAGATAAEPNARRKTKMARTTSASSCVPSAGDRHITASEELSHRYVRRPEEATTVLTQVPLARQQWLTARFPSTQPLGRSFSKNRSVSKNRKPKEDRAARATAATVGAESALFMKLRWQISDLQRQLMKPPPATNIQDTPLTPLTSPVHVVPKLLLKPVPVPEKKPRKRQAAPRKAAPPPLTERDVEMDDDTHSVVSSATVLALEQQLEARAQGNPAHIAADAATDAPNATADTTDPASPAAYPQTATQTRAPAWLDAGSGSTNSCECGSPVEAAARGPRASNLAHTFVRRGIPMIQYEPDVSPDARNSGMSFYSTFTVPQGISRRPWQISSQKSSASPKTPPSSSSATSMTTTLIGGTYTVYLRPSPSRSL
ncbi:hypothetical protein HPB47_014436 [Ixodes persulcatus]|uniref:Uncharacterized protein n=1 Tax=Ixodes persulcatus TaxID=34615 RepID=A0AC60QW43_IXOPE|nr:hypothetical protein HPB47_014436 [Ixodes persulcatus]